MHNGWFQIAYTRELEAPLTPGVIGEHNLVLLSSNQQIRAFDATCPHRGAHLGYGGQLDGDAVVCPFHGKRIRLGRGGDDPFCVREYPTLSYGGLIFVRLGTDEGGAFEEQLAELSRNWVFVPGFSMNVSAPYQMVIENAFDNAHFRPMHRILNEPEFTTRVGPGGEFEVEGSFELPPSQWQRGDDFVTIPFVAKAFSPAVVISRLGGEHPYCVITSATPEATGGCVVRLSVVVPAAPAPPDPELCKYLLQQSAAGLQQDSVIWTHMAHESSAHYCAADRPVIEFRRFCRRFASGGAAADHADPCDP